MLNVGILDDSHHQMRDRCRDTCLEWEADGTCSYDKSENSALDDVNTSIERMCQEWVEEDALPSIMARFALLG
jgi:hypothetical protein